MAGKNRTRWGKLGCMLGKRRAESERSHVALPETDAGTLLVIHCHVAIHRLIEMG